MAKAHNCITESKSVSLDVRILKVAERLAKVRRSMLSQTERSMLSQTERSMLSQTDEVFRAIGEAAETLQDIAAEIRAAPIMLRSINLEAILASFAETRTDQDLSEAWRDAAPSLKMLSLAERQTITEAWITRLCVVCQDDGW